MCFHITSRLQEGCHGLKSVRVKLFLGFFLADIYKLASYSSRQGELGATHVQWRSESWILFSEISLIILFRRQTLSHCQIFTSQRYGSLVR